MKRRGEGEEARRRNEIGSTEEEVSKLYLPWDLHVNGREVGEPLRGCVGGRTEEERNEGEET